jgi:hypothetical protein
MRIGGRFHTLSLETGDGSVDVRVAAGSKMDRGWSLTTGDGALSLALPAAFAGELDVVTHGGHIDSDFPGDMREENSRLQARLNNGAHLFRVRTGDGSIRIRKQ